MWELICLYLGITGGVYIYRYYKTPEEKRPQVRKKWFEYYVKCLNWPIALLKLEGF